MYIMTPVLKTIRLLLCNIVRYTFPKTAVDKVRNFIIYKTEIEIPKFPL